MTVRNLATLDRTVFQPLGRILQEAFADGLISTGTVAITRTIIADPADGLSSGQFKHVTILNGPLVNSVIVGAEFQLQLAAGVTALGLSSYVNTVLRARIDEYGSDQPNMSGAHLSGISFEYYVDETGGAPYIATPLQVAAGAYKWDGLLSIMNPGDCGDATCDNATTQDDAADKRIPIFVAGQGSNPFYLRAYATAQ